MTNYLAPTYFGKSEMREQRQCKKPSKKFICSIEREVFIFQRIIIIIIVNIQSIPTHLFGNYKKISEICPLKETLDFFIVKVQVKRKEGCCETTLFSCPYVSFPISVSSLSTLFSVCYLVLEYHNSWYWCGYYFHFTKFFSLIVVLSGNY